MEPAFAVDSRSSRLGHFVVTLHYIISACNELSVYAVGAILARFGVDYLALNVGESRADSFGTNLKAVVNASHSASGRCLGLTVNADDLAHIHFSSRALHKICRAV